jgi:hypothetical protein
MEKLEGGFSSKRVVGAVVTTEACWEQQQYYLLGIINRLPGLIGWLDLRTIVPGSCSNNKKGRKEGSKRHQIIMWVLRVGVAKRVRECEIA